MKISHLLGTLLIGASAASMHAQSGGPFSITSSVIAGGGGQSTGDIFTVIGTTAESAAGEYSAGSGFEVRSGFWNVNASELVVISGNVLTPTGAGVRNSVVVLTDGANTRSVRSGPGGAFIFDQVETGRFYTIAVRSKRYRYSSQTVDLNGPLSGLQFHPITSLNYIHPTPGSR